MANVMLATRQATTDVLSTVSATTGAITHGVQAVANLATVAEAHSSFYRDRTILELQHSREELEIIARDNADVRIARARLTLEQELSSDKDLKKQFDLVRKARLDSTKQVPQT